MDADIRTAVRINRCTCIQPGDPVVLDGTPFGGNEDAINRCGIHSSSRRSTVSWAVALISMGTARPMLARFFSDLVGHWEWDPVVSLPSVPFSLPPLQPFSSSQLIQAGEEHKGRVEADGSDCVLQGAGSKGCIVRRC